MPPHGWVMHAACRCHDNELLQEIAFIFSPPSKTRKASVQRNAGRRERCGKTRYYILIN